MQRRAFNLAFVSMLLVVASTLVVHKTAFAAPISMGIDPFRFEFSASPGEAVHGTVFFSNGQDTPLPLRLEEVACRPDGEEGKLVVDTTQDPTHSLKDWVHPRETNLVVPPQTKMPIDFDIRVPPDAKPGAYWGLLVMNNEGAYHLGLIILGNVLGPTTEKLAVASFKENTSATGALAFVARLKNEGEFFETPQSTITMQDVFGRTLATSLLPAENVLPGVVRKFTTEIPTNLWPGVYRAELQATYGKDHYALSGTTTFWVVPKGARWLLVIILALAALASAMLFWRHYHRYKAG